MIEDFEDLDRLRAEAEQIDTHKYSKRKRAILAVLLGAFLASAVYVVLEMLDQKRNPCERLHKYVCAQQGPAAAMQCKMYTDILRESVDNESKPMREQIRSQCLARITHLVEEENATIP